MEEDKKPKTLLEKIFSLETLLFSVGLFLIGSGFFYSGEPMQYFFGGMIVCGSIVLHFVRKKDWKKHWEEQEMLQRKYEERIRLEKEQKNGKQ